MVATAPPRCLHDLSLAALRTQLIEWGFSPAHAAGVWRAIYHQGGDFSAIPSLPPRLQARLQAEMRLERLASRHTSDSCDGLTRKYLLALGDGRQIETVLMRYPGRVTACLSTQAGCALGCVFCATGQQGFFRNLTTSEIVAQALHVRDEAQAGQLSDVRLRNVVLMGMGEPLLNYDSVMAALEILCDPGGLAIAQNRITLSTVGIVPGIVRLADEGRPYSLAVSLHAADQEERAALVPVAKTWPLAELMDACRYYSAKRNRRVFFEWTLIDGVNDSPEHARQIARLLTGMAAHVNLIPLNRTPGYAHGPAHVPEVSAFQAVLKEAGIPSTIRQRRGLDIAAGCGQLAAVS